MKMLVFNLKTDLKEQVLVFQLFFKFERQTPSFQNNVKLEMWKKCLKNVNSLTNSTFLGF